MLSGRGMERGAPRPERSDAVGGRGRRPDDAGSRRGRDAPEGRAASNPEEPVPTRDSAVSPGHAAAEGPATEQSDERFNPELILRRLNAEGVRYVLIGGFAVIVQGYERFTSDLDLCYERSRENVRRLVAVLRELQADVRRAREEFRSRLASASSIPRISVPRSISMGPGKSAEGAGRAQPGTLDPAVPVTCLRTGITRIPERDLAPHNRPGATAES